MSFNESQNTESKKCENSVKLVIDCDRPLGRSIHRSLEFHFLFWSIFYCWCFVLCFDKVKIINVNVLTNILWSSMSTYFFSFHLFDWIWEKWFVIMWWTSIFLYFAWMKRKHNFFLYFSISHIEDVNRYNTIQTQIQLIVILTLGIVDKMDFRNSEKKKRKKRKCVASVVRYCHNK